VTGGVGGLIDFLRARLDEDERIARAATPGPWRHNPGKQWLDGEAFERYDLSQGQEFVGYGGPHPFTGAVASTGPADHVQSMKDAAHIARHDPARVLAEVEAKRRILDGYAQAYTSRERLHDTALHLQHHVLGSVVRLLALPYADHPDYQDGWC
jgi:hypothetical protein